MQIYGYHRTSTKEQHLDRGIQEDTAVLTFPWNLIQMIHGIITRMILTGIGMRNLNWSIL